MKSNLNADSSNIVAYFRLTDRLEVIVYEAIAPTFLIVGHPEDCISHVSYGDATFTMFIV